MATFPSTTFANFQPRFQHEGVTPVVGTANSSDSTQTKPSTGDVVFLCKIPHGAVILDLRVEHSALDTVAISYGLASGGPAGSATFSGFVASLAKSTISRMSVLNTSQGYTVSVSDNDPNRYGILSAKFESGSYTNTVTINWQVLYHNYRNGA